MVDAHKDILDELETIKKSADSIRTTVLDGCMDTRQRRPATSVPGDSKTRDDITKVEAGLADIQHSRHISHEQTLIKQKIAKRKALEAEFGANLVADPVWIMLLELYLSHLSETRISVTSLSIASGVPSTTALRWIALLEKKAWIERSPDPLDARRIHLKLSRLGLRKVMRHT